MEYPTGGQKINKAKPDTPFRHTWILTRRTFKMLSRDLIMVPARALAHIIMGVAVGIVFGTDSGELNGCALDILMQNGSYLENFEEAAVDVRENLANIYFTNMLVWFGSIFPILLTFPLEMNVFSKEYHNGWYSCFSYFVSKIIADIPFQLTIPNLMSVTAYYFTGQPNDYERVLYFCGINILIAIASQSMGLVFGALLMEYPPVAAFLGTCMGFPLFLFGGFLFRWSDLSLILNIISYHDFIRFGLESSTVAIYGLGRCDDSGTDNFNETATFELQNAIDELPNKLFEQDLTWELHPIYAVIFLTVLTGASSEITEKAGTDSIAMLMLDVDDDDLWLSAIKLVTVLLAYQVIAYFILRWKANRKSS